MAYVNPNLPIGPELRAELEALGRRFEAKMNELAASMEVELTRRMKTPIKLAWSWQWEPADPAEIRLPKLR